jgi:hypothetical protein
MRGQRSRTANSPYAELGIFEYIRQRAQKLEEQLNPRPAGRMGSRVHGMACRAEQNELKPPAPCRRLGPTLGILRLKIL